MLWKGTESDCLGSKCGWRPGTSYRFYIKHCPSTGFIHVKVYEENTLLHDTGDILDTSSKSLNGGRIGVWCNSQEKITWSFLRYRCLEGCDTTTTTTTAATTTTVMTTTNTATATS